MPQAQRYDLTYPKELHAWESVHVERIYLSARYARREEILSYATYLRANGFEITSRWLKGEQRQKKGELLCEYEARIAGEDVADLVKSDCCICFTDQLPQDLKISVGNGGRNIELGLAIGAGKKCIIIGPREHIFHHLPKIDWFDNWVFFCECLKLQFSWLDIQRRKK